MRNIVLTGLMGSGKTTTGKLLAQKLNMVFIDSDELIIEKLQKTIPEIFELYGEEYFRKVESEVIKEISIASNQIISTGGGVVEKAENIENLREKGIIFYLYAPADILYNRVKDDSNRPLLNNNDQLETLNRLLEKREPFYNLADVKIDTAGKSPEEITEEIIYEYKNSKCTD